VENCKLSFFSALVKTGQRRINGANHCRFAGEIIAVQTIPKTSKNKRRGFSQSTPKKLFNSSCRNLFHQRVRGARLGHGKKMTALKADRSALSSKPTSFRKTPAIFPSLGKFDTATPADWLWRTT
jgi:hypothetical protein